MFLASNGAWAGVVLILLTTGISVPCAIPLVSEPILSEEGPALVDRNDVKKIQESLRIRGHYRGKVDGVFGLRTHASIRAYQKAQNLPITGQVDTRTADGLGVRPESNWGDSKNAGDELGPVSDETAGVMQRDKPSACIRKVVRKANRVWRKDVSRSTAPEDKRGVGDKQQAENGNHDQ